MLRDNRTFFGTGISLRGTDNYPMAGDIVDLQDSRDFAAGSKPIYLVVQLDEDAAGGTSAALRLMGGPEVSTDEISATGRVVLWESPHVSISDLTEGFIFTIPLPQVGIDGTYPRYLQMGSANTGAVSTLNVSAWLSMEVPKRVAYPDTAN